MEFNRDLSVLGSAQSHAYVGTQVPHKEWPNQPNSVVWLARMLCASVEYSQARQLDPLLQTEVIKNICRATATPNLTFEVRNVLNNHHPSNKS